MVVGRGSQDSGWGLGTAGAVTPCQCLGIDCGKWCSLASAELSAAAAGKSGEREARPERAAEEAAAISGPGGCPLPWARAALESLPPSEPGQAGPALTQTRIQPPSSCHKTRLWLLEPHHMTQASHHTLTDVCTWSWWWSLCRVPWCAQCPDVWSLATGACTVWLVPGPGASCQPGRARPARAPGCCGPPQPDSSSLQLTSGSRSSLGQPLSLPSYRPSLRSFRAFRPTFSQVWIELSGARESLDSAGASLRHLVHVTINSAVLSYQYRYGNMAWSHTASDYSFIIAIWNWKQWLILNSKFYNPRIYNWLV